MCGLKERERETFSVSDEEERGGGAQREGD